MGGWAPKRGEHGTMAERIARTREAASQPADEQPSRPPREIRPCWVRDADDPRGQHPGLLLDWRQEPSGVWKGRVCHQVLADDGWIIAEEWLPADRLRPG